MLNRSSLLALGFTVLAAPWCSVFGGAAPANAFLIPGKADLAPVSPPNSVQFCKSVAGQLRVAVRVLNHGKAYAPASITTVDFFSFGRVNVPTAGIQAGNYIDLDPIAPPAGCFQSDCVFKITVNSDNRVDESNLNDNSHPGGCVG
jgi:CARDB